MGFGSKGFPGYATCLNGGLGTKIEKKRTVAVCRLLGYEE